MTQSNSSDIQAIFQRINALDELMKIETNPSVKSHIEDSIKLLRQDAQEILQARIQAENDARAREIPQDPEEKAREIQERFEQYVSEPHDFDDVCSNWGRVNPTSRLFFKKQFPEKWAVYKELSSKRVERSLPHDMAGFGEDLFSEEFNPIMLPSEIREYCRLAETFDAATDQNKKMESGEKLLDFRIKIFTEKWQTVERTKGKEGHWHYYPHNRV